VSQHATFLLLGLANGAVFAALGLGLVVTHRSTKVLNLGIGAVALFSATIYTRLRRGELVLLVPGLPEFVEVAELGFVAAAALALAITGLLGVALYLVVYRPLRNAPPVASAVASLGISVVITGLITQRLGTNPGSVTRIFTAGQFTFGDAYVTKDRVFVAGTVIVVASGVWAVGRFTRFGLISRAVSQSEKGAYVTGLPAGRVAAGNWILSFVVAGVAGILIAPIVPPVPVDYSLFVVPALAVATLGGFERLAPTVLGGLALGMIQSELAYLQVQHSWIPSSGAAEMVPLILVLVVLVVRAKPLPTRGVLEGRRLGRAPRPRSIAAAAIGGAALASLAILLTEHDKRAAIVTTLIFAILALSQVVVTGYSGQISLAQLTLAGVSGFLMGTFTTDWGVPFPIAPLLAAVTATVIGVAFALPAVRIRGLSVAVVTLALAVALEAVWFRNTDLVSSSGKSTIGPTVLGLDLTIGSGAAYPRLGFSLLVVAVLVLVGIGVAKLRLSALGAAMLAVRANEKAAAAAGVNVVRTKVAAFAIGAFIAGLAGSMLAYKQGNVTVASFSVYLGLSLFATSYLAGITSVSGGILAGFFTLNGVITTFAEDAIDLGNWYSVIAGAGMVYSVISSPEGIVGPFHELRNKRFMNTEPANGSATANDEAPTSNATRRGNAAASTLPAVPALSIRQVTVRYGGVTAVSNVTFDVPPGTITGLIGPNGAGKTSLLDAISGFAPSGGDVEIGGISISASRADERSRAGLGRTFQSIELYDDLTVVENIAVGQAARAGRESDFSVSLEDILEILGISRLAERPAGELSQGTRQLVSIARALAGWPDVLLLDEPAAGLDSTESRWLGTRLERLRSIGIAILLVDHDLQLILDLCDEVQVLDFGTLIASGPPESIRTDAAVRQAYIGGEATSLDLADDPLPPAAATVSAEVES
jgi:ABC-type branched-subunit amino acid transport system ATPase component/branched-subunit amino acid ABC-type transport system permease component